ncbi:MAG: FG-GAP-like repeat-containing protein [Rubripirellula sp.]
MFRNSDRPMNVNSRLKFLRFTLLWLCVLNLSCSKKTAQPISEVAARESHQQMIDLLKRVAKRELHSNEYFNSVSLLESSKRALLDATTRGDLVQELENHKAVGLHELNIGNSAEACKHLSAACDLMPKVTASKLASISPAAKADLLLKCGIAYLRLGEDENCVHCTDGKSCILPIEKDAIHKKRAGSENAMKYFKQVLEVDPRNAESAWLLNVAAMTLGEYPDEVPKDYLISESRFESKASFPRFPNISAELGLDTLSHAGGVIADDFDGDDLLDVLVSSWNPGGPLRLFRNQGDGQFVDVSEDANLEGITGGLNTVHADYDNDGDLDVYVLRGAWLSADVGRHPNSLLQNDGAGRFTDVTFAVGLGEIHHPTQTAAWGDYDNDGDLDLYVGNEKTLCQLYRNDEGRFVDVAEQAGVQNSRGFAKAVCWGDFDGDRWLDLYVSNLGQDNLLFQNNRDGTFKEVAKRKGVAKPIDSFASWFWDYNNDGHLDLFVGSYSVGVRYVALDYLGLGTVTEKDCLYEGDGKGGFDEVGSSRGLVGVTQPMGCNYGDLDNDGYLDFYLGTGYPGYDGLMPNVMYRNREGKAFDDVTYAGGFGHLQKGHGIAFADFDHDGDQDVFAELGGAFQGDAFHNALFQNPGFENHWIKVRLVGKQSNRCALGAQLKVTLGDPGAERHLHRRVSAGSSFGGNPLRQEIGLGNATVVRELEVYWPVSDITQTFKNLDVDQFIVITEGESQWRKVPMTQAGVDAN